MMKSDALSPALILGALILGAVTFCGITQATAASVQTPLPAQEKPLPAETNPPGDIPDLQIFITYGSPQGFAIKVPEGWARSETSDGVRFVDKFDSISVQVGEQANPPTVASVRKDQVPALEKNGRAVRVSDVKAVSLPAGQATLIAYASNSARNPVTDKAVRLENHRYLFWKQGKLATLTLSAPYGADNVDQWRLMAHSFRWQ